MSGSSSLLRVSGSSLLLLLCGVPAVPGQTMPIRDYQWIKAFVRAAFPDLAGHRNVMQVRFDDNVDSDAVPPRVLVTVRGPAPAKPEGGVGAVLLTARFASPPDSVGDSAWFDTPEGHEAMSLRSISEQAALHPEWTDEDLLKAMHGVGADYPLDRREAFVRHLDVTRFARVLGVIHKVQVDFVWRRPEARQIVIIGWRVRLDTVAADGRVSRYRLAFEPMRGRLVSLSKEE